MRENEMKLDFFRVCFYVISYIYFSFVWFLKKSLHVHGLSLPFL